ncbi:cystatin-A1-like [Nothobranchius furzeri]|uniref:Cystatin-A1-like n=1 Tax=Nothobranchius furzeri TaxID=105023 RepID=A0A9D2YYB0_NOTFU|nr:cystatin-A1-like [Nothobranchius furzeri]
MAEVMTGGWSGPQPADQDIKVITSWMKNISEAATQKKYEIFEAVEFWSQVVAGVNYRIKVHVGGNHFILLKIWQEPLLEKSITTTFEGAKDPFATADIGH